ncbi:MAG: BatD family protein [Pseudomonadales bacterium]
MKLPKHAIAVRCYLTLLCLFSAAAVADVRTFIDPKVLDETETLRLTLRLDGAQRADAPELAPLEADFEVLGSSSSSQYRSINGQVQAWVEYQINLRPRRSGTLTIPALAFGGEYSDPTEVEVRALDPVLRQEIDRMVFFETEVTPNPVYVQAEIKVVRRLFYATSGGVQMYSELPGAPEIADAVVIPLSNAESLRTRRNGIDYNIVEQRFAVYPERSGSITIPAVSLTSSVRVLKDGRMRRSGIRVSSQAHTVTVLPIPAEYPSAAPWLPATAVELSQTISPQTGLETGTPLTRTLRARVTGNVSSAIAPIVASTATANAPADGFFREYPQAPETTDVVHESTNVGSRQELSSLLPIQPGIVEIPAQTLTWWDTSNARVQVARANAVTLNIAGERIATNTTGAVDSEPNSESVSTQDSQTVAEPALVTRVNPLRHWRWLALAAALIAAGLLLFRWVRRHPQRRRSAWLASRSRAAKKLNVVLLRRQLQQQLENHPEQASARRVALLRAVAAARHGHSADAAKALNADTTSAPVLQALDALCYAAQPNALNPSDEQILIAFDASVPKHKRRPASVLPPLYPSRS